jgi:acetyl-CoA decarbonylase/synthase complex subunit epsilon
MAMAESWQKAEVPGPLKAMLIPNPDVAASLISKSKNPVIVSGSETPRLRLNSERLMRYVERLSDRFSSPIIATSNTVRAFDEDGWRNVYSLTLAEATAKLSNPNWSVGGKNPPHDTAVFIGFKYYTLWLALSNLKHYGGHLKTISLERYYQPHAAWSFPNLTVERWMESLEKMTEKIGG